MVFILCAKSVLLFKKRSFDIFDMMKKFLHKPVIKKTLIGIGIFIVFVILMDNIILPWYVSSSNRQVPSVVGLKADDAIGVLKDANLEPIVSDTTYDEKFPKGTIIYQRPVPNETVKKGRRVYLFVSGGEPLVPVPSITGKTISDARNTLERLGLNLGKIDSIASEYPANMIFGQQYTPGTPLKKGDYVGVRLSIGSSMGNIAVPNVIGKSLAEAEKILADSSLKVGKINYQPSYSLMPNTILDQYPSQGNKVNAGDAVDLFVTKPADSKEERSNKEN
ncbi:MAG: PASTA domain-containing protein [Ignavibacteriaceae bacterium]|nr:PASTA domain-containing protein [Ignavibacteriaceae bacterium]